MSEENNADHEHVVSLGNKLSLLRQKLGLSQADIAAKLHLHSAIIEQIETDNIPNIPNVFIKSYIKSYAEIVGLPAEEYSPFLHIKSNQQPKRHMKNYSQKSQHKRLGKMIFLMTIITILIALGITWFSVWNDNNNNFIEISHYVSPPKEVVNNS